MSTDGVCSLLGLLDKMISTMLTSSPSHRGPVSLPRTGSSEWLIALSCLKLITVLKPFTIEELEETDSHDRNS